MARKRQSFEGKLRTREHILADLSVNHLERQILLRGFAVSRIEKDYGLDLIMHTFTDKGEVENGYVLFQVKATDDLKILQDGKAIALRVEVADVKWWLGENMPVILVLYDGKMDKAYWLYVQQFFEENKKALNRVSGDQDRLTLRIPLKNRLGQKAIETFRQFRDRLLAQIRGALEHEH